MADKSIKLRLVTTATGLQLLDEAGRKITKISAAGTASQKGLGLLSGGLARATRNLAAFAGAYMGFRAIKGLTRGFMAAATVTEDLSIRFFTLLGSVE